MSREIKFRAKEIDNNEWVYGYLSEHNIIHQPIFSKVDNIFWYRVWHVKLGTVCQFSGLKDSAKIEIYEGDILKSLDALLTVFYNDATACFDILFNGDESGDCEGLYNHVLDDEKIQVIGNIYDNMELLNP